MITPIDPTVKEAIPPLKNSLGVTCSPPMKSITMAPISPITRIDSLSTINGSPLNNGKPPSANGPIIIPATNSPNTIGNLARWNPSARSFAAKRKRHIAMIVRMSSVSTVNLPVIIN